MANAKQHPLVTYLLWVAATTLGWSAGLFNLDTRVETYLDVLRLVPAYLLNGLLIGLVTGLCQVLVLRGIGKLHREWIVVSAMGYGLTFLGGLLVSVLIPTIAWLSRGGFPLPFTQPTTVSMIIDVNDLFWCGFLLGILQWRVLKKIIQQPEVKKAIAWVMAPWVVLGMSVFVRAFAYGTVLFRFQMSLIGLVMGAVTGWLLLTFLGETPAREQRPYLYEN